MIYHLIEGERWRALAEGEDYAGDTLATEGFIHCATREQVAWVARRWFAAKTDLVVLEVDEGRLRCEVRWVESEPGRLFPHVHGPIAREAIVRVAPFGGPT